MLTAFADDLVNFICAINDHQMPATFDLVVCCSEGDQPVFCAMNVNGVVQHGFVCPVNDAVDSPPEEGNVRVAHNGPEQIFFPFLFNAEKPEHNPVGIF